MSEQPIVTVDAGSHDAPPPFDPDPGLVADRENNRFALRAFREGAKAEHARAEKQRSQHG